MAGTDVLDVRLPGIAPSGSAPPHIAPSGIAPSGIAPPDTDTVRAAVRLGWYLAELRGRFWWQGARPMAAALPIAPPFALPLRPERSDAEAREQACETVVSLARRLGVDEAFDSDGVTECRPFSERWAAVITPFDGDGERLLSAGEGPGCDPEKRDAAWGHVAELLYEWDAGIQDGFAARADVLANAYLLGRGLSESYWALGPDDPAPGSEQEGTTVASAWTFLFGDSRRSELSRLVGRVAPHVNPLTPAAISGSIEAWGAVVRDEAWRTAADARRRLYEQLRRWYELLILSRDPTTFVRPYAMLRGWRTSLRAVRAFGPQLVLALASAVAVGAVVWLLGSDRGTALLRTVLGLLGIVGLTTATIVGRAKAAGQRLLARLRQDAYSDLVALAITSVPDHPAGSAKNTERLVRHAVRLRSITPVTPLLDTSSAPR